MPPKRKKTTLDVTAVGASRCETHPRRWEVAVPMRSLQRSQAGLLKCWALFFQKLHLGSQGGGPLQQPLRERQEKGTRSAETLHACSDSLHLMQEAVELRQG